MNTKFEIVVLNQLVRRYSAKLYSQFGKAAIVNIGQAKHKNPRYTVLTVFCSSADECLRIVSGMFHKFIGAVSQ